MTSAGKGQGGEELSTFQKMVRGAVSSVVPGSMRVESGDLVVDDYISHYNCKPPPLFMIIISLAEVLAVNLSVICIIVTMCQQCGLYNYHLVSAM